MGPSKSPLKFFYIFFFLKKKKKKKSLTNPCYYPLLPLWRENGRVSIPIPVYPHCK
jgi:alpha-amylase/alpha-mannosidase (GH57 family)